MSVLSEILFWIMVAFVLYIYFGYPILLLVLSKIRLALLLRMADITHVSLIISAYNEEKVIAKKIENALLVDYSRDSLEISVASGDSMGGTNEIVRGYGGQGIKLVPMETNHGKSAVEMLTWFKREATSSCRSLTILCWDLMWL